MLLQDITISWFCQHCVRVQAGRGCRIAYDRRASWRPFVYRVQVLTGIHKIKGAEEEPLNFTQRTTSKSHRHTLRMQYLPLPGKKPPAADTSAWRRVPSCHWFSAFEYPAYRNNRFVTTYRSWQSMTIQRHPIRYQYPAAWPHNGSR